jgi:hypothetical protein
MISRCSDLRVYSTKAHTLEGFKRMIISQYPQKPSVSQPSQERLETTIQTLEESARKASQRHM